MKRIKHFALSTINYLAPGHLQGEHYGEISNNGDREAIYHLLIVHGFKEFYLKWLYEECQGYDISGFENRSYETIEEHLEQYKAQHELMQLSNIFSKFNKRCAAEGFSLYKNLPLVGFYTS